MNLITGGFPEVLLYYKELTTNSIREIRKAYHNAGDMKLKTDYRHLLKPEDQLPMMNFRTYKSMNDSFLKNAAYMRDVGKSQQETAAFDPTKDPLNEKLNSIMEDADWYRQNPESWSLNQADFSVRIAKRGLKLSEADAVRDIYTMTLRPPSCTCPTGPACAHYMFIQNTMGPGIDKKQFYKALKERMKMPQKKSGKDYGSKQPRRDSGIDPKLLTPRKKSRGSGFSPSKSPARGRRAKFNSDSDSDSADSQATDIVSLSGGSPSRDDDVHSDTDNVPGRVFEARIPQPSTPKKFVTNPKTGRTIVTRQPSFSGLNPPSPMRSRTLTPPRSKLVGTALPIKDSHVLSKALSPTPPITTTTSPAAKRTEDSTKKTDTMAPAAKKSEDSTKKPEPARTIPGVEKRKSDVSYMARPEKKPAVLPFLWPEHRKVGDVNPSCVVDAATIDLDECLKNYHDAKKIRFEPNQAAWVVSKGNYISLFPILLSAVSLL